MRKTLPYDVLDDVLKKPKHRAYDVSRFLKSDYRGYHGGKRTIDTWEDQKAGGPKNLIAEEA